MKNYFNWVLLSTAVFALSACNTFIGIGQDIEGLGSGMQNKGHGKAWNETAPAAPAAPAEVAPAGPAGAAGATPAP